MDIPGVPYNAGVELGEEHKKNARSSSRGKHEKGQARKQKDASGEKGDKRRKKEQRTRPRPQNDP